MIQSVILGIPSYRQMVLDRLIDMTLDLAMGCMHSEALVRSGQKPADRLVLPSHQQIGFHWMGKIGISTCSISRSRNKMLWLAMKSRADWLLMCDADTVHVRAADTLQMLATGYVHNAAVIAAPVLCRDGSYNVVAPKDGRPEKLLKEDLAGKVQQVARIGTAFMALNVRWFAEHWPRAPWFRFQDLDVAEGAEPEDISEDFFLCDGVIERGGKVLADGRFEPYHEGAPRPVAQAA